MKKLLILTLAICLTSSSFAGTWQMVGARQMGLGGAGVAIAEGADAQYYNPALLAVEYRYEYDTEIDVNAGVQTEFTSVIDAARQLMRMSDAYKNDVKAKIAAGAAPQYDTTIKTAFKGLGQVDALINSNPAVYYADAGFGIKHGGFAFSMRSLNSLVTTPKADGRNILLKTTTAGLGINASTSIPSNATLAYQKLRNQIKDAIDGANAIEALKKLFGLSGTYTSEQMANIISNNIDYTHYLSKAGDVSDIDEPSAYAVIENMAAIVDLINKSGDIGKPNLYSQNTSHVKKDFGSFNEATLGYGFKLLRGLNLGFNVKVIEGVIAEAGLPIMTEHYGPIGSFKETCGNKKYTAKPGVDVGASLDLAELFNANFVFHPVFAVVGKNLNNPKFRRPEQPAAYAFNDWDSSDYRIGRQYRAGAAIRPFTERLTVTADIDLSKNKDITGREVRELAGGVELLAINRSDFKLPVRLGINKNLENNDEPLRFTAGFGTMASTFAFDLGIALGDDSVKVNTTYFPNVMNLSMTFAWIF